METTPQEVVINYLTESACQKEQEIRKLRNRVAELEQEVRSLTVTPAPSKPSNVVRFPVRKTVELPKIKD
jgi:uncharacterized coiled-coil protein SlyX